MVAYWYGWSGVTAYWYEWSGVVGYWCGGSVCFTTAIPGDSTNGGSPVGVGNANNYTDTELSQYLQLPVHSVGDEI